MFSVLAWCMVAGRHRWVHLPVLKPGTIHGLLWYWNAYCEATSPCDTTADAMGDRVPITTFPGATDPPDHWRQAFSMLPVPIVVSAEALTAPHGVWLKVCVSHNDDDVWFHTASLAVPTPQGDGSVAVSPYRRGTGVPPPICSCSLHVCCPPQLIGLMNQPARNAWLGAMCASMKPENTATDLNSSTCVDRVCIAVGDNPALGVHASKQQWRTILAAPLSTNPAFAVCFRYAWSRALTPSVGE